MIESASRTSTVFTCHGRACVRIYGNSIDHAFGEPGTPPAREQQQQPDKRRPGRVVWIYGHQIPHAVEQ